MAAAEEVTLSPSSVWYPFVDHGKWGYIDRTGAWMIPPRFERCQDVFEGERVQVWQGNRWGYVNRQGDWIVPPRFTDTHLDQGCPDGLEVVSIGKKQGILQPSGPMFLPVRYDDILLFGDRAWVRSSEKLGLFSLSGRWIKEPSIPWPKGRALPIPTEDGVSWFQQGHRWGLLSAEAEVLFPARFPEHVLGRKEAEEWTHPEGLDFKHGRAWVTEGKDFLLISSEGKVLTRQPFGWVKPWTDELYLFHTALPYTAKDRVGLISREGIVVLPADRFTEIRPPSEGRAVVAQYEERRTPDGRDDSFWTYGYIDTEGHVVVPPGVYAGPGVTEGGGQTELAPFVDGLAPVWNDGEESSREQVYDPCAGYIDRDGTLVISEQFYFSRPFSEGLGAFLERKARPGFKSAEAGLWGYVDHDGVVAIAPQFEFVTPFRKGRAWALKAGVKDWAAAQYAMIDQEGHVLIDYAYRPPERTASGVGFGDEDAGDGIMKSRWRGDLVVLARGDFLHGLATADGKVIIEPIYNRIGAFHDGVAVAIDSRQHDAHGNVTFVTSLLTEQGRTLATGVYATITDFAGGVAWVTRQADNHQSGGGQVGWGLLDTSAHELTPTKFLPADWVCWQGKSYSGRGCPEFHGDLAAVTLADGAVQPYGEKAGLQADWGYVDHTGKVVAWHEKSPSVSRK